MGTGRKLTIGSAAGALISGVGASTTDLWVPVVQAIPPEVFVAAGIGAIAPLSVLGVKAGKAIWRDYVIGDARPGLVLSAAGNYGANVADPGSFQLASFTERCLDLEGSKHLRLLIQRPYEDDSGGVPRPSRMSLGPFQSCIGIESWHSAGREDFQATLTQRDLEWPVYADELSRLWGRPSEVPILMKLVTNGHTSESAAMRLLVERVIAHRVLVHLISAGALHNDLVDTDGQLLRGMCQFAEQIENDVRTPFMFLRDNSSGMQNEDLIRFVKILASAARNEGHSRHRVGDAQTPLRAGAGPERFLRNPGVYFYTVPVQEVTDHGIAGLLKMIFERPPQVSWSRVDRTPPGRRPGPLFQISFGKPSLIANRANALSSDKRAADLTVEDISMPIRGARTMWVSYAFRALPEEVARVPFTAPLAPFAGLGSSQAEAAA